FHPDGKQLATASADHTVKLWDLAGDERRVLKGPGNWITDLAFSPDGQRLVSASGPIAAGPAKPNLPRVWDAATGQELFFLKGHTQPIQGVAWSADGKQLATA